MKKLLQLLHLTLSTAGAFAQINLSQGLKAHYTFNGNSNDAVGGYNATVNGASLSTDRFGNSNSSYFFDGVDDFIEIPASANLKLAASESYTISLYAKIDSTSGTFTYATGGIPSTQTYFGGALVTRYGCTQVFGAADWLKIAYTNNSVNAGLREKNGSSVAQINKAVSSSFYSQYHHIVLIRNAGFSFATLYIDGAFAGNTTISQNGGMATDNVAWWIGKDMSCNDGAAHDDYRFFKGKMDEIRIYNRVLNNCELNYLANGLISSSPSSNAAFAGFTARYLFDGNTNDAGPNGYNATLTGATLGSDRFSSSDKSYSFDGNDFITISSSHNLRMQNGENYSLMVIAKVDTTSGWYTYATAGVPSQKRYWGGNLITRYGCTQVNGASDWLKLRYDSNFISLEFREKNASTVTSIEYPVNAGFFSSYHEYIGVRDATAGKIRLYIDGVMIGEQNLSAQGGMSSSGVAWWIGKDMSCNDGAAHSDYRFIKGKIDEIGLYDRALDSCEIEDLHSYLTTAPVSVKGKPAVKNSFMLYPNPSKSGGFSIRLDNYNKATVRIEIRNMIGQSLFEDEAEISNGLIHINNLPLAPGIYLISVGSETQKLLIE